MVCHLHIGIIDGYSVMKESYYLEYIWGTILHRMLIVVDLRPTPIIRVTGVHMQVRRMHVSIAFWPLYNVSPRADLKILLFPY